MADNKYHQLRLARDLGLSVPEYITSNEPESLRYFTKQNQTCAMKLMSQDLYRSASGVALGLYVNIVNQDDFQDFGSDGENPITIQKYINKKYEVRCTYIADQHFVCKIDSQSSSRTTVDWRRYDVPRTPHSAMTPPEQIRQWVNALSLQLGIVFGAADFIADEDDKWWFLEVNSNGQWLWIEDLTGMQIS